MSLPFFYFIYLFYLFHLQGLTGAPGKNGFPVDIISFILPDFFSFCKYSQLLFSSKFCSFSPDATHESVGQLVRASTTLVSRFRVARARKANEVSW